MSGSSFDTASVAITGSSGQVGRALQARLRGTQVRVVPLGREDDLARGMANVEVVVHLAGGLRPRRGDTYVGANLGTVRSTIDAMTRSTVERVVFLSFVTADPASANPYLRAKGRAEQALLGGHVPAVIFRTGHVIGPPDAPGPTASSLLARRGRVTVLGDGRQRIAPILLEDVVEALVQAALGRDTPTGVHPLTGPDVMTMDDLVRLVNGDEVRIRHLSAGVARGLARFLPSLPRPLVDVMVGDAVAAGGQTTARDFGLELHGIGERWAPSRRDVPAPTATSPQVPR